MSVVTVREVLHNTQEMLGKTVTLKGWVRTARDVKACAFVELNDGSTVSNLQVVYDSAHPDYAAAAKLNVGCAVIVEGEVIASPNPKQPVELKATALTLEESGMGAGSQQRRIRANRTNAYNFIIINYL